MLEILLQVTERTEVFIEYTDNVIGSDELGRGHKKDWSHII